MDAMLKDEGEMDSFDACNLYVSDCTTTSEEILSLPLLCSIHRLTYFRVYRAMSSCG